MSNNLAFIYSDDFMAYFFGKMHPFNPIRLKLTYELIKESKIFDNSNLRLTKPQSAELADIARVHTQEYIEVVRSASQDANSYEKKHLLEFNLGTGDNPIFPGMFEATLLLVGSTLTATRTSSSTISIKSGGKIIFVFKI